MVRSDLLVTLVAALVAAFIGGFVAIRLRLPPMVGYLIAGVVIGPFTPGGSANPAIAAELAEVGVILLMFGVGIHFSLRNLLAVRAVAVPGAIGQIAVATALGTGLALWWGWEPGAALVLGLALSVASTVVLLRALEDRGALASADGHVAVGWLIVEDLFTVLVLVLLPVLASALANDATARAEGVVVGLALALGKAVLFAAIMLLAGSRALPWLLTQVARSGSRELFTLGVLTVALGVAFGSAELFGVSLALGAFLAGVVLGESDLGHEAAADALPMRDAFAVLFFVSVGMLFDPAVLVDAPVRVLVVVAVITAGKAIAAFAIVAVLGRPARTGLTVAAGLGQIGEFSFILIGLGGTLGLVPAEATNLVLAGSILSIMLNPLLFAAADRMSGRHGGPPGAEADVGRAPRQAEIATRSPGGAAGFVVEHVRRPAPWLVIPCGLGVVTLLALGLEAVISDAAAGWLYLLAIPPVARRWGRRAGMVAAALGALLLLVIVIEPRVSLAVADPRDYLLVALALGGMLLVAATSERSPSQAFQHAEGMPRTRN